MPNCDRRWMPNHDRFECQTAIDSDAILQLVNASKLMTEFDDNGKIIFNLNTLKYTKASYFEILGEKYIKITTSSTWLLEKLGNYILSSRAPQVLELAIGWRGAISESIKGDNYSIWFSVAWITLEVIMRSERDLVNFFADFLMDVDEAVIPGGVATAIGSLASFASLSFGLPLILVGGAILL